MRVYETRPIYHHKFNSQWENTLPVCICYATLNKTFWVTLIISVDLGNLFSHFQQSFYLRLIFFISLQCRHNERDGISNHRFHHCLINRLFICAFQRNHQSSALLAFVWGIQRWPGTRKMFPFCDFIKVILLFTGVFIATEVTLKDMGRNCWAHNNNQGLSQWEKTFHM